MKTAVTKNVAIWPRQAKTTAAMGSGSPHRRYSTGIESQPVDTRGAFLDKKSIQLSLCLRPSTQRDFSGVELQYCRTFNGSIYRLVSVSFMFSVFQFTFVSLSLMTRKYWINTLVHLCFFITKHCIPFNYVLHYSVVSVLFMLLIPLSVYLQYFSLSCWYPLIQSVLCHLFFCNVPSSVYPLFSISPIPLFPHSETFSLIHSIPSCFHQSFILARR